MANKIYLSPSDQYANTYAYGDTVEAVQCQRIANACETALKRCGFEVRNNQTSSMQARVAESNRWGADLHVPIHTNAYNTKVTGTRLFCWSATGKGHQAALKIFDRLAPITPGTSESIKVNTTLYEIKYSHAPCVYCECEFHDNKEAAKWIIEHVVDIGEAIAHGIVDYFGVRWIPADGEPVQLYHVQVGAFAVKANADTYLAEVKKHYPDAFIVRY